MVSPKPCHATIPAGRPTFCRTVPIPLALALTLAACGAPSVSQGAPTETQVPPSPTAAPTTLAPTETATITATAKPRLGPELPATSLDQVAGRWSVRIKEFTASDWPEGTAGVLTLAPDGTYSCLYAEGFLEGALAWGGPYRFQEDVLFLDDKQCLTHLGESFPCTGTYHVFVAMADDAPGSLRFVAIEDPWEGRNLSLTARPFYSAEP